ncbi:MAG: phosphoribosylanthranilate isomerase [Candidatus Omnitrophota bacterium]|nr:phosphoribosylanthranilate isomerase [Candidatus Omnitrophota bacterium]
MTKVKICGITNLDDALAATELGADFLGFVFSQQSPRQIKIKQAVKIISSLPGNVSTVGLFVNQRGLLVKLASQECGFNYLQFHGDESPHYCQQIRKEVKIIKAFRVKDKDSLKNLADYDVDIYLLDAYNKDNFGGSGSMFNWDLAIEPKKIGKPIILAGGLTPKNVIKAIEKVRPYAVDVSSGIEKGPGRKDHKLIKKFIEQVRSAG